MVMSCIQATITPYERVAKWLEYELAIISGDKNRPNEFELFIPVEVREEFKKSVERGSVIRVTRRSLKVWAAIAEVSGPDGFTKPLGWSREDIETHLLQKGKTEK
jgi:hypothetical protein